MVRVEQRPELLNMERFHIRGLFAIGGFNNCGLQLQPTA
jgi:hypothetical protein